MATSCTALRTSLARQTPVYDEVFLQDFTSDMVNEPFVGRHQTETWEDGAATRFFDKIHIQQPNYLKHWRKRDSDECAGADLDAGPPRTFVGFGTTRDSYYMEQIILNSQPFNLDQLRNVPHLDKQIREIYRIIRTMPLAFIGDFLRSRFFSYHDKVQIAGSSFNSFVPTTGNCDINLAQVNITTANLPTSELTWSILLYYTQLLGMRGYSKESGLSKGMFNLVTHSRTFAKLVGMNPEIKSQLHLVGVKDVSPLYELGTGINADPFGPCAPTFDEHQIRFQDAGSGLLERVLPYQNSPATTGEKPLVNTAWFNARYGVSYLLHPKAAVLFTPKPKKVHEMIPSVNSAMWGSWDFVNPQGAIIVPNPDGTTCTHNNDLQWWFYWLCYLEAGFKYEQRDLVIPILHLIDGSGKDCVIDSPVCGSPAQYVAQTYSGDPDMCTA